MGNKMTPLQALKKVKQARYFVDFELDAKVGEDYKEELSIIETALKEYDLLKRSLNRNWVEVVNDDKKLKALEIIKESVGLKMSVDEEIGCLYVPITKCFQPLEKCIVVVGFVKGKEKIDLLKEELEKK